MAIRFEIFRNRKRHSTFKEIMKNIFLLLHRNIYRLLKIICIDYSDNTRKTLTINDLSVGPETR